MDSIIRLKLHFSLNDKTDERWNALRNHKTHMQDEMWKKYKNVTFRSSRFQIVNYRHSSEIIHVILDTKLSKRNNLLWSLESKLWEFLSAKELEIF